MTRTIKSFSDNKHYFLTIDQSGHAVDCTCPDHQYRGRTCKHMRNFNQVFEHAVIFAALKARFDCRSQAVIEAKRANYFYYEMSIQAA